MRNKLVFESDQIGYKWGKYNVVATTYYNWYIYTINTINTYGWGQYSLATSGTTNYYWNKYNLVSTSYYWTWKKETAEKNDYDIPQLTLYTWNKYQGSSKAGTYMGSYYSFKADAYPTGATADGYFWDKKSTTSVGSYMPTADIVNSISVSNIKTDSTGRAFSPIEHIIRNPNNGKIDFLFNLGGLDDEDSPMVDSTLRSEVTSTQKVQELYTKKLYFCLGSSSSYIDEYYGFTELSKYENGTITNVIKYTMPENLSSETYYGEYFGLQSAIHNDYYQKLYKTVNSKGTLVGEVSSTNQSAYPQNGASGRYWYEYLRSEGTTTTVKGDYIKNVTSTNSSDYPDNGQQGNYWYVSKGVISSAQEKGNYYGKAKSIYPDVYPNDGISNGYWYKQVANTTKYSKGTFIENVINTDKNAYPSSGQSGDYWYEYVGETAIELYTIDESILTSDVNYTHDINNAEDFVIGTAASAQIKCSIKEDVRSAQKYQGLIAKWYNQQGDSNTWKLMGSFVIDKVTAKDQMTSNLLGYDFISKFDVYVDDWLDGLTFPMTIGQFYKKLCEKVGVKYKTLTFLNSDYSFQDNFTSNNITGRQMLQYVAQCAGAYASADTDGVIDIKTYKTSAISLDKTKYQKLTYAYYTTKPITKLTVQMSNDDLGVSAGTGDNIYKITNNPIFYFESESQALQPVQNIFNAIKTITYTPCEITLLQDFNIECGDIITVNDMTVYVMSKEITGSGVKLKCMGNEKRAATGEETNSAINALRGKTNSLQRTIEQTQSTLTDTANSLQSQITQTANELTTKITDTKSELETEITQKTDSISATVTSQGELIAQLRLDVDGINLTGYVTFNDLKNSGSTVINGDNITTGTINADRINMTGAINWGDLSSSCQSTIEGMSSGGASVPSYIKSTYIDSTTIMSPTIYGGTITAGTDNDGYLQMAATGMQYYAAGGSILCDIGYQENAKNLPYILLGQGKDSSGTGRGMIKKYVTGLWIGDNKGIYGSSPTGTGIFINFNTNKVYKYINGTASLL